MSDWFRDGMPVERLPIDDRGLQYGDGLFETIAIRDGKPRFWSYHAERLAAGCKRLAIRLPAERELLSNLEASIKSLTDGHGLAKIVVSAGTGARGYGRAFATQPTVIVGVFSSPRQAPDWYRDGIEIGICETRLATGGPGAGLKTLNRLEQVLARSECSDSGLFESLTLDPDDNIICGTMSNVFFVINNEISTPALDRCGVAGVMRRHVIATLQGKEIEVAVQPVSVERLGDVDEMFLSNSQFGVLPVRRCGDRTWTLGDRTRALMTWLAESGVSECRA